MMLPFDLPIVVLFCLSVHDAIAARMRPSSLQASQHVAEYHEDTGINSNSTDGRAKFVAMAEHRDDMGSNLNSTDDHSTFVADRAPAHAHPTAQPLNNSTEEHLTAAAWQRSFKEVSSLMEVAVLPGWGAAFAVRLLGGFGALVLLGLVILYLCGESSSEDGSPRGSLVSRKEACTFTAPTDTWGGPSSTIKAASAPCPLEHLSDNDEQQDSEAFGEVLARLSQTIKKVPRAQGSYRFRSMLGIGPQERHFAIWWGVKAHTWATAKLGWWKTKQSLLERKAPKGDLYLKDVSQVRFIGKHSGFSDPGVCVTSDGADDLLMIFQNSDIAKQYADDLILLVEKVKGAI